jgi:peptide/nickel transport system substrate-binding protein
MLTRRDFLRLSAMSTAGLITATCSQGATVPEVEQAATPTPAAAQVSEEIHEAPMLHELVQAGQLPPLAERLPANPLVVEPVEEVGQYGGTWHAVHNDTDAGFLKMKVGYDVPIGFNREYSEYIPILATSWEFSDDGRTVTIHFREGIKWSDGEPFTTEDLRFWWEDLALNEDYKVITVPWWMYDYKTGNQAQLNIIDDYTISFTFDSPAWLMPGTLGSGYWEWEGMMKPKHYLQQFHPGYTSGADWTAFQDADKWWQNPDYPVIYAWRCVDYQAGQRIVLERNPYYWKVDSAGNQLPYIDRIESVEVEDGELRLIQAASGEYDAVFRGVSEDARNFPFLLENAEQGDYRVLRYDCGCGGEPSWLINQDYVDDEWVRDLLRDHRFMMAISHAVDRERINEVVWDGLAEVAQGTIGQQSWHFQGPEGQQVFEEWKNAYAEYDPDTANSLLDELGLTERDAEGFRTRPDGSKLEIIYDVGWGGCPTCGNTRASTLLKENWEAVGLRITINNVWGTPQDELRATGGQFMIRAAAIGEFDLFHYPDEVFPVRPNRAFPMVGQWYATGGQEGWPPEPGSAAEKLISIYEQILAEPDQDKRHRLVWDAIRVHIEQGPSYQGAVHNPPQPVVVKNNFRNVPEHGILGPWAIGTPGNFNPEQFFFKQG